MDQNARFSLKQAFQICFSEVEYDLVVVFCAILRVRALTGLVEQRSGTVIIIEVAPRNCMNAVLSVPSVCGYGGIRL